MVVAVFELLPGTSSGTSLEAVAVLLIMVPPSVPALILTTTVKLAVSPPATDALVNISVPVPPATESAGSIPLEESPRRTSCWQESCRSP